jgi:pyrroloquinoline quinone biosynthesis protein D
MTTSPIAPTDRFEIRPPFMFRWEDSQNAHVLLYPEGIVKLNKTGGDMLSLCDGNTSVAELIETLISTYDGSAADVIRNGVMQFLEVSRDKGWIRIKA